MPARPGCRSSADSAEEHLGLGVQLGPDDLELGGRVGKWHAGDVGAAQRDHLAEVAAADGVDGMQPEPGGQHAVEGGGRTTTLDVAEHGRARLLAGALLDLRRQPVADAAEANVPERVEAAVEVDVLTAV